MGCRYLRNERYRQKVLYPVSSFVYAQNWDTATRNEVRRFVFSGPLTPNGVALRDYALTKK